MKIHTVNLLPCHLALGFVIAFPILSHAKELTKTQPFVPKLLRNETTPVRLVTDSCGDVPYPKNSWRHEEEGTTVVFLNVANDGRVLSIKIARSSGFRDLDKASVEAAGSCLYRPATIEGKPVQSPFFHTNFVWKLD